MTNFSRRLTDNWQDVISLILGVWLILSPWLLGFALMQAATWNAIAFGIVIALMAFMALFEFHAWEEWADMAVGVWLIVSPWVLGFAMADVAGGYTAAAWNVVIVGILTFGMAAWSLRDHRHHSAA